MAKSGKTRKSITKRFKITKTGKILRRISGQDHLLAKQTGKKRRLKRRWVQVARADQRRLLQYLHYQR